MSNTSIGSGNADDTNENPAPDSHPSKTMGAESGPDERVAGGQGSPDGGTETDVLAAGEFLRDIPARGVPVDPKNYPDGPNVAASPWELNSARGHTELPSKD